MYVCMYVCMSVSNGFTTEVYEFGPLRVCVWFTYPRAHAPLGALALMDN